jgi:phosphopantetheinyl transferase (holo-ACP synthase)
MRSPLAPASLLGVGIDLAERSTFGHLDDGSIRRAAVRWLRPGERAWCGGQPAFREAVVVLRSCKEALYKAWGGSGQAHDIALTMYGRETSGWAVRADPCSAQVVAAWQVSRESILTVAVAAKAHCPRRLVALAVIRLFRGLSDAGRGQFCRITATPLRTGVATIQERRCQHAVLELDSGHVSCRGVGEFVTGKRSWGQARRRSSPRPIMPDASRGDIVDRPSDHE